MTAGQQSTVVKMNDFFPLVSVKQDADKGSVMVWGTISATRKTELVIVTVSLTANQYTMFYGFIFCPSYNSTTETLFS